ncbi:MAG: hypothetical protein ACOYB3_01385 [Azonexus sp.]
MSEDETKQWVAPLVRTMLTTKPIDETAGPMTCPICDCDHQVFQGMGVFAPDKEGTHLICAFPSTETLAKIDMPDDIKVGGLMSYTRYSCGCNGHRWALLTAFMKDRTTGYCIDLTPQPAPKGKNGKKAKKTKANPGPVSLFDSLQTMLKGMVASGAKPVLMLGAGITQQLTPEQLQSLQAQGAQIVQATSANPPQGAAEAPVAPDHEDPLADCLPATVRYAWMNWNEKTALPEEEILNFQLPKLPITFAAKNKPPHLAVGTDNLKLFALKQEWVFALAVELKQETRLAIHSIVYWENLLIVVSNAAVEARKSLAHDLANTIISMKKFKPNLYMMTRKDYSVLVKHKAAEAAKKAK